ncbi:NAD(+) synthase [Mycoplasmopsis felis]|uniref:NAD(+) synthase n=1 Tax=Mycoplasmopsis felis TaxID=33923 RepID=UPI002AFF6934|nr:NAD(+) synthase [Mycoplasmopsis felis]WQQ03011.1 NAD(+) synthase [Mycoplasmopsis felis]WQQ04662.1 NAD(+) synthase [Mycoplasmopsis felis]
MSIITKYSNNKVDFDKEKALNYIEVILNFLQKYLKKAKANGFVIGISGGIDSALTYALAKKLCPKNTYGIVLPIKKMTTSDLEHINELEKRFNDSFQRIDLTKTFNELLNNLTLSNLLAIANIKPRLRMTTLYAIAQEKNSLVLGTDNADEVYIGYFTKFGDGGADLLPISQLTKAEVKYLAKLVGIPDSIINKKPSAGLWEGQTDENELGFSYDDLDFYLNHLTNKNEINKKLKPEVIQKIKLKHKITQHKRDKIYKPNKVK